MRASPKSLAWISWPGALACTGALAVLMWHVLATDPVKVVTVSRCAVVAVAGQVVSPEDIDAGQKDVGGRHAGASSEQLQSAAPVRIANTRTAGTE